MTVAWGEDGTRSLNTDALLPLAIAEAIERCEDTGRPHHVFVGSAGFPGVSDSSEDASHGGLVFSALPMTKRGTNVIELWLARAKRTAGKPR